MHDNARTIDSIAKELNIEENRIQKVRSIRFMFRYLMHIDQPNKTPYAKEEIHTNVKELVDKYCKVDVEPEQITSIYEFIYRKDSYIYYHEVLEYVLRNNFYATYRRGNAIISKIIDEHNKLFLERKELEKTIKLEQEKEIAKWEKESDNGHTKNKAKNSTKA